jgi:hypothetical protein
MQSPKARRDLLLGRTKSKISSKLTPDIDFVDDYIREIIQRQFPQMTIFNTRATRNRQDFNNY